MLIESKHLPRTHNSYDVALGFELRSELDSKFLTTFLSITFIYRASLLIFSTHFASYLFFRQQTFIMSSLCQVLVGWTYKD